MWQSAERVEGMAMAVVQCGASFSPTSRGLLWPVSPSSSSRRQGRSDAEKGTWIQCRREEGVVLRHRCLPPSSPPPAETNTNTTPFIQFFHHIASLPPPTPKLSGYLVLDSTAVPKIIATILVLVVVNLVATSGKRSGGSVGDLVKRGQLRSDRSFKSQTFKYEDPFNNPIVKKRGENPIVRMCGKIFRLQPVTLTQEKMLSHQTRRVHAYQWKRPTVFLIEGEPVPDGVDPETVRWIPSNHPFATAQAEIDEASAEMNVYQTRGAPSRVRAEHEALRKRMMRHSDLTMATSGPSGGRQIAFEDGLNDEGAAPEGSSRKEDAIKECNKSNLRHLDGKLLDESKDQIW